MRISDWSSDVCSSDLGGLAGAREAEEDRGVACWAYVRRAVHREHVAIRQQVVENREHRLLDLARIDGADRKSVVEGKSVSVRVDLGGRRIIKKKNRVQSYIKSIDQ